MPGTVHGEVLSVAGPLGDQAPVLDCGVRDSQPHGQHVRPVRLGVDDPRVLVPGRGGDVGVGDGVWKGVDRRLDPGVLDRVRVDLGSDDRFRYIEQPRVREQAEHGRTGVHGVGEVEFPHHRQADVKVLVDRVHVVHVLHRLDVAFGEGGAPQRRDPSLSDQASRHPVEDLQVLVLDRRQLLAGEHVLHYEVPVLVEPLELPDGEAPSSVTSLRSAHTQAIHGAAHPGAILELPARPLRRFTPPIGRLRYSRREGWPSGRRRRS